MEAEAARLRARAVDRETRATVAHCSTLLRRHYGSRLKGLVLYGSAAAGVDDAESDIDLLVLLAGPLDYLPELRQVVEVLYPAQLESSRLISAKPADADEYERGDILLYRNAQREGIGV